MCACTTLYSQNTYLKQHKKKPITRTICSNLLLQVVKGEARLSLPCWALCKELPAKNCYRAPAFAFAKACCGSWNKWSWSIWSGEQHTRGCKSNRLQNLDTQLCKGRPGPCLLTGNTTEKPWATEYKWRGYATDTESTNRMVKSRVL